MHFRPLFALAFLAALTFASASAATSHVHHGLVTIDAGPDAVPADGSPTDQGGLVAADAGVLEETDVAYTDARESLTERIRLVEPDFDREHPFRAHEVTGGPVVQLEHVVDEVVRLFEVRGGTPADDGASGYAPDRWRAPMSLRVRYPASNRLRAEDQIASDIPRLTHALIHPAWPVAWHESIESVTPPSVLPISELQGEDGPIALLLTMRFDLIYRDTGGLS